MSAASYSDSGNCVVIESRSGFCSLDWRQGVDSSGPNPDVDQQSENGTNAFRDFALDGSLPDAEFFSEPSAWDTLYGYSKSIDTPWTWKGAATYLERTPPEEYEIKQAFASIASLVGSVVSPENKLIPKVLLTYISLNDKRLFSGLIGKDPGKADLTEIGDVDVWGNVSRGCLELFANDGEDIPTRIAIKTPYASAGAQCQQ